MNPLDFSRIKDEAHPEDFLSEMKPFGDLMMYYRCAMMEVETKFKVLNEQFSTQYNRNPIESIKTRLKKPVSIIDESLGVKIAYLKEKGMGGIMFWEYKCDPSGELLSFIKKNM